MKKSPVFVIFAAALVISSMLATFLNVSALTSGQVICESEQCQQMELNILRSTVRIHLQVWQAESDESGFEVEETVGHATLRDGRYLVTHNHFSLLDQTDMPDSSMSISLYNSSGQFLLSAPLRDFNVTLEGQQTRVFEIKNDYIQERLAAAGVMSAEFRDWHTLELRPGMKVAQVDWDGSASQVEWTMIEEIITHDDVPRLHLNNGVTRGGSGGGIFLNGVHIANNWQTIEHRDSAGNIVYLTSVAPLDR